MSAAIVDEVDFLPTFAHLAGAQTPEDRPIDGVNMWPFLHGDATSSPRQLHVYTGRGSALRVGPWKLVNYKELFNLATDIAESTDVATKHPDIVQTLSAYQTQVQAALKADQPLPPPPTLENLSR